MSEITAFKDTYVNLQDADANFGSSTELLVRNQTDAAGGADNQISLFSFNINDITSVTSNVIIDADFELFKNSGRGDREVNVFGIDESFDGYDEGGITWNTASFIPPDQTDAASTSGETPLGSPAGPIRVSTATRLCP